MTVHTVTLQKVRGGLVPADATTQAFLDQIRYGDGVAFDVRVVQNARFHRKVMALLRLGFDAWNPIEIDGRTDVVKTFDKFRQIVCIQAGHYDVVYRPDGSFTLEPRSLSYAKCDNLLLNDLYGRLLDVTWEKVLRWTNYSDVQEVELTVNRLVGFEG